MLATLSFAFTNMTEHEHRHPARRSSSRSPTMLEDDAEVMSNTQLADAARRRAARGPGGDHRASTPTRATARPAGRAARPDPRRPARPGQLVPDDAPAGRRAVGRRRGHGPGLSRGNEVRAPSSTRSAKWVQADGGPRRPLVRASGEIRRAGAGPHDLRGPAPWPAPASSARPGRRSATSASRCAFGGRWATACAPVRSACDQRRSHESRIREGLTSPARSTGPAAFERISRRAHAA